MRRTILMLLLVCLSAGFFVTPSQAQKNERCFEETGYCISGAIRAYWERNGGLAVFGFPITDVREEYVDESSWRGPVQWFERDRLEDHGNGLVLAGRLGAELLSKQQRPWEGAPKVESAPPGCRYFAITGHSLCEPFLSYWEQNGGLERFGYPITQSGEEVIEGQRLTVQHFERRRMEHHVELAGTPFEVQLGLLGRATAGLSVGCFEVGPPLQATAHAYRDTLGCAQPWPRVNTMIIQPFERGTMAWVNGIGSRLGPRIFVIYPDQTTGQLVWQSYSDQFHRGAPPAKLDETPPEGLYAPGNVFGKVWAENSHVYNTLGWATSPENRFDGVYYRFDHSSMLYRSDVDRVYILRNDGRVEDIQRIP
ncbi:MAG: hypothetical protein MI924_04550 [Chloroflexales bacterium]|nr:hypothetical protein [Chloroflexales bacterium]